MELVGNELYLSGRREVVVAQCAYIAHSPIHGTSYFSEEMPVAEPEAEKVLIGLAKISLGKYGPDYHSVKSEEADYIISELSGSVEDFFGPLLA